MPDWIALTPSLVCEALEASQNETLGARPNQGTALDPLSVAIADATARVRAAVRGNGLNRLSADPLRIPPELQTAATTLARLRLAEIWPLFYLGDAFEPAITEAEHQLKAVSDGTVPITQPADPEPGGTVRHSAGASLEHKRTHPLRADRLRGL